MRKNWGASAIQWNGDCSARSYAKICRSIFPVSFLGILIDHKLLECSPKSSFWRRGSSNFIMEDFQSLSSICWNGLNWGRHPTEIGVPRFIISPQINLANLMWTLRVYSVEVGSSMFVRVLSKQVQQDLIGKWSIVWRQHMHTRCR